MKPEKNKIDNHRYLKILKYVCEHERFRIVDLCEDLGLEKIEFARLVDDTVAMPDPADPRGNYWVPLYSAFIDYLEYIELNEARQSAKTAKTIAIIAIIISIVTAGVSIHYSRKQLATPTVINKEQFVKVEEMAGGITALEEKLNRLAGSQEMAAAENNKNLEKINSSIIKALKPGREKTAPKPQTPNP